MDLREIRQLIKLLADTDIAEIEIREEAQTVRITRQMGSHVGAAAVPYSINQPMLAPSDSHPVGHDDSTGQRVKKEGGAATIKTLAINSPMVGTYYHATSPDALPFVSRGDVIKKGQVVCIIEAMKLMNEIESEYSGRVVSILKENASPVEYGETLFVVEPV